MLSLLPIQKAESGNYHGAESRRSAYGERKEGPSG